MTTKMLNFLLIPIFKLHRYFVNLKRSKRKLEALKIIALIDQPKGCIDAENYPLQRLSHLMDHYRITYAELGLRDHNDLRDRVNMSLARAESSRQESPGSKFLRELSTSSESTLPMELPHNRKFGDPVIHEGVNRRNGIF